MCYPCFNRIDVGVTVCYCSHGSRGPIRGSHRLFSTAADRTAHYLQIPIYCSSSSGVSIQNFGGLIILSNKNPAKVVVKQANKREAEIKRECEEPFV